MKPATVLGTAVVLVVVAGGVYLEHRGQAPYPAYGAAVKSDGYKPLTQDEAKQVAGHVCGDITQQEAFLRAEQGVGDANNFIGWVDQSARVAKFYCKRKDVLADLLIATDHVGGTTAMYMFPK